MSAEQQISARHHNASAIEGPHWEPPSAPLDMPTQVLEAQNRWVDAVLHWLSAPMLRLRG
ncbi:hypothetical protein GLS40_00970 [Pseudooceanicola sp. 216_PA32_1]|uniref:Uncharacterized protein n=1 Tax=Pseudooceanicola pacificus TaxID=2676438 RepID=A0A844WCY3_9RHOB|nr:hypothetical protein [Pseudooceanicola pacificus]MWB76589.1 hypothetical protein [Pseudooceanicola pacificus]